MITTTIFLVLSLSSSLGYNILSRVRSPSIIQHGAPRILELNDEVEDVRDNDHANSMVRRLKSLASSNSKHVHKPRSEAKYQVKILDDQNNLLSVEIDDSLEKILDSLDAENERYKANSNNRNKGKKLSSNKLANLDLTWADIDRIQENSYMPFYDKIKKQSRLNRPKNMLNSGFKSMTLNEHNEDRQTAKITDSSDAVKIIRSLEPPKKYYEKYLANNEMYINGKNNIESMFDENGMMFLTKPKHSEERTLNTLLNKILQYKELQRRGYDPDSKQIFSKAELKQINKIAEAIIEENRQAAEVYELDKLFLREQREIQEKRKADLKRLPEILKSAVPELPHTNSMKEKLTKTFPQHLKLDDDQAKNREEDVKNKANLVRLVAQAVEQVMGDSQEKRQTQDDQWDQKANDDRSQRDLIEENLRHLLSSKSPDKGGRIKRQKRIAATGSAETQSDDRDLDA